VKNVVQDLTSGGLAAVSSSFFAALCSAFGRYDVVHIHAEGKEEDSQLYIEYADVMKFYEAILDFMDRAFRLEASTSTQP